MTSNIQKYRKLIEEARDLPALSPVIRRLNELIRNPTVSAAEVGQLISQDIALSSTTLKLVNSPFYGFSQKISSITHAIVIMGFNKVKNIALAASILQGFREREATHFDYNGFWEHAIGTAIAAEVLAQALNSDVVDEAFISGLLHDQGKLMVVRYFDIEFAQVRHVIERQHVTTHEAENEVLGFNHALVGTWLAEKWNYSEPLSMAIRMHHSPLMARQHRELVWLIHAADIFCRALGIGNGGDPFVPELDRQVWEQLKLTSELVDQVLADILKSMERAGDFLELVRKN